MIKCSYSTSAKADVKSLILSPSVFAMLSLQQKFLRTKLHQNDDTSYMSPEILLCTVVKVTRKTNIVVCSRVRYSPALVGSLLPVLLFTLVDVY